MHELSIALSLIDAVVEELDRRGGLQVRAVHLRVGELSGVDRDALTSAFEIARKGSPLDGVALAIEHVRVVVFCSTCQCERGLSSPQIFVCPICGTPAREVVRGKELEIAALECD